MRFIKEHSDTIVKLMINQVGIAIFAFFLYTAAGAIKIENSNTATLIKVGISVFSILFYFVLLYYIMWEIGGKDKIRIDAGRLEAKSSKGILIGLAANSVNFIIIGAAVICLAIYMISGAEWLMSTFAVLNAIYRIFVSMYLGAIMGITATFADNTEVYYLLQSIGFLVFSLISAVIIHLSYLMGLNNKRLFGGK